MRILFTGAKGNLGREFRKRTDSFVVELNRGDWHELERKFSEPIDIVIHAAYDTHTTVSVAPVQVMEANVLATCRLLEAAARFRVPRFVYVSSCAVYGEARNATESTACCPAGVNGISKLLNENVIVSFCGSQGMKFEILRVFNLYGGDDHFSVLHRIARALESNTSFVLNNCGKAQRDFIHVADVARILAELVSMEVPYTHLNVGTGIATTIADLIALVRQRFPALAIKHSERPEVTSACADISALRRIIDWEFIRVEDYVQNEFMRPMA